MINNNNRAQFDRIVHPYFCLVVKTSVYLIETFLLWKYIFFKHNYANRVAMKEINFLLNVCNTQSNAYFE